ncbi:hypothetical protein OIH30_10275 [Lactococcus petauri]|uniref:hypothetical protein n=1 Tax=Lactococcus petauri TaxID=1940789 RepID=UPI0021F0D165|nr:hypothetical protein [Lactococcus petauri]MCV5953906.1 hypothetical protein [Lactococcus petauri]
MKQSMKKESFFTLLMGQDKKVLEELIHTGLISYDELEKIENPNKTDLATIISARSTAETPLYPVNFYDERNQVFATKVVNAIQYIESGGIRE